MDWTSIIIALLASGTLTTIVTLRDKKTAAVLDNIKTVVDQWHGRTHEKAAENDGEFYQKI